MQYDVEADWQLLYTCNYRCPYCFIPPVNLGETLTVYAEPETWKLALDQTGLTWLLHITGGEPTIYPRFAELCQLLTATHFLSLNSNLTHSSVVAVANQVNPSRISFINAALHPEERQRKKGLAKFLEHAQLLIERSFPVFISVVATPEVLSRVDDIIALTAPIGLPPIPKLLRGGYNGKIYPQAYSPTERLAFKEFARRARGSYSPLLRMLRERPSIDVFGDEDYLEEIPSFEGRACNAGEKFVSMQPDGRIYRCEPKRSNYLGNILDGSCRLKSGKSACDLRYCFYWCLKYSAAPAPASGLALDAVDPA